MSRPSGEDLQPVRREPTPAIIADRLRVAIMRGAFPPGTQLGEVDLAGRLGVSRGPLREAMQRLVAEGLLRSERHRGLFVVDLGIDDVNDVYAARLAIEQAAARMVLRGDRRAAVAELSAAQEGILAAADDPVALADADQEFHTTLVRVSGSPRLRRMAQTLLVETRMCLAVLQHTGPKPEDLVAEHRALLESIRDGDERRVLSLLEEHMHDAVARVEHDLAERGPDQGTVALAR